MAGKRTRESYLPLADNPDIQMAMMIKLGIDTRTAEQVFRDEIKAERAQKEGIMTLKLSDGSSGGPVVNMMIDTRKNYQPKQDLSKPEKSIKLMQQKGIAGQKTQK